MRRSFYILLTVGGALAASLLMTACTPARPFRVSGQDGPRIEVVEPAPFATTTQGRTIIIRASIADPNGIQAVSLRVNGQAAQTLDLSAPTVTALTQELFWTPEQVGTYEIQVDALNRDDVWGNSEPMTVYVVGPLARETIIAVSPTPLEKGGDPDTQPTEEPTEPPCVPYGKFKCRPCAPPYAPTHPDQCRDSSAWVTDVSVPDGTVLAPGTAFDKTWRLKNTGTCTWDTRYQLAFVGGSQLSAPSTVNMPHEVKPGSSVDVTVRMVAPDSNGTYRSNWRMRNPDCGNLFGPIVYALIEVHSGTDDLPRPTPSPPPSSPNNLAITGVRRDGFDFTWIDTSNDEQGFRLYNANTQQTVADFPANVTSRAITGLDCGTPYSFYLVSFNESGESWPSNTVQDTTSPCDG